MRRCPQTGARAAPHARAGRAADSSAAARSRVAHERSNATLPTNSVRAQRRTLAPGARKTAQPHARNHHEREVLDGQIAISQ